MADKEEQENKEYTEGYKLGRDGDPMSRGAASFFGFTKESTTFGKGFVRGISDKHRYGKRGSTGLSSKVSVNQASGPKKTIVNRTGYPDEDGEPSHQSGSDSHGIWASISSNPLTLLIVYFVDLFIFVQGYAIIRTTDNFVMGFIAIIMMIIGFPAWLILWILILLISIPVILIGGNASSVLGLTEGLISLMCIECPS